MSTLSSKPVWQDGLMMIFKMWQRDVTQRRAHPKSATDVNTLSMPNGFDFTYPTPNLRSRLNGIKTRWADRLSEGQLSDLQKAIERLLQHNLSRVIEKLQAEDAALRKRLVRQKRPPVLAGIALEDHRLILLSTCFRAREGLLEREFESAEKKATDLCLALAAPAPPTLQQHSSRPPPPSPDGSPHLYALDLKWNVGDPLKTVPYSKMSRLRKAQVEAWRLYKYWAGTCLALTKASELETRDCSPPKLLQSVQTSAIQRRHLCLEDLLERQAQDRRWYEGLNYRDLRQLHEIIKNVRKSARSFSKTGLHHAIDLEHTKWNHARTGMSPGPQIDTIITRHRSDLRAIVDMFAPNLHAKDVRVATAKISQLLRELDKPRSRPSSTSGTPIRGTSPSRPPH